jgi:hypothetical protein
VNYFILLFLMLVLRWDSGGEPRRSLFVRKKNEGPSDKVDGKLTVRPTTGTVQSLRTILPYHPTRRVLLGFPTDALRQLRRIGHF